MPLCSRLQKIIDERTQLRDGSTLSDSKRHKAGVPPRRAVGGRLPGGACIPPLLESWKHKILLAGKYLNVIRECGIEISREQIDASGEKFSMDDERSVTSTFIFGPKITRN